MARSVSYPLGAVVAFTYIDDDIDYLDWQDITDNAQEYVCKLWPSFEPVDYWRDREDRVLARNNLAEFGVSEYCGIVAFWLVARDDLDYTLRPLADAWLDRVAARFVKTFGTLHQVGHCSNGEAVYERIEA